MSVRERKLKKKLKFLSINKLGQATCQTCLTTINLRNSSNKKTQGINNNKSIIKKNI